MLSAEALRDLLGAFPTTTHYWIAFSGGLDSVVLTLALKGSGVFAKGQFRALHCNHGLQPEADGWAQWCRDFCSEHQLPCEVERLQLAPRRGESLEAVAREARYAAIASRMAPGDVVFTAHHGDDQVETVLLQLLRGSGLPGLSGMSRISDFPPGFLVRPFLGLSRDDLEGYARDEGLRWIEDVSNNDLRFDRNYLRHRVVPTLRARWPGLIRTVSRSAELCGEAQGVLDEIALRDLEAVSTEDMAVLDAGALSRIPNDRWRYVLRAWFRRCGVVAPPRARLDALLSQLFGDDVRPTARVAWQGNEVRRYRNCLYLLRAGRVERVEEILSWMPGTALQLPYRGGRLHATASIGRGVAARFLENTRVEVRFRRGGERCRMGGKGGGIALQTLFQSLGIPPWERGLVPLVYVGSELAAVADLRVCSRFAAREGEPALEIRWEREYLPLESDSASDASSEHLFRPQDSLRGCQ